MGCWASSAPHIVKLLQLSSTQRDRQLAEKRRWRSTAAGRTESLTHHCYAFPTGKHKLDNELWNNLTSEFYAGQILGCSRCRADKCILCKYDCFWNSGLFLRLKMYKNNNLKTEKYSNALINFSNECSIFKVLIRTKWTWKEEIFRIHRSSFISQISYKAIIEVIDFCETEKHS